MSQTPLLDVFSLIRDAAIYPLNAGGSGGVPTTRTIFGTAPVLINGGASGTLAGDLTVSLSVSPNSSSVVGIGRLINGTAPIRINGGASIALGTDITISALTHDGTRDGIVVKNPSGIQGKYYKDDGTWGTSSAAGVTSITTSLPLVATAPTGDIVMAVNVVNLTTAGIVPAIGVADGSKALLATNPPTWGFPGTGNFVLLQASMPSTPDAGAAHIDNIMQADQGFIAGSVYDPQTSPCIVLVSDLVSFVGGTTSVTAHPQIAAVMYTSDAAQSPSMGLRRSRGSHSAPVALNDNDAIGSFRMEGRASSGWSGFGMALNTYADGIPSASVQKVYSDLVTGAPTQATYIRSSKEGVRIGGVTTMLSGDFAPGQKAVHGLDIRTSFGFKTITVTGNYSADAIPIIFADATGGGFTITLPAAVAGRMYTFIRLDNAGYANDIIIKTNGGSTIYDLPGFRQTLTLVNDGTDTGWRQLYFPTDSAMNGAADGIVVANTVAETTTASLVTPDATYNILTLKAQGVFSTTGTPTLRFRVKSPGANPLADSGAITMPNTLTNAKWALEVEIAFTNRARMIVKAELKIAQGTGLGAAINSYEMTNNAAAEPSGTMISITLQWGTADPANTAQLKQWTVLGSRAFQL